MFLLLPEHELFFVVLTGSTSLEMGATWAASLASVAMAADGQLCYTNSFKKVSGLCSCIY